MSIPIRNFALYGNTHADRVFAFGLPAGQDFAGAEFKMHIRPEAGAVISKSSAAGGISIDGSRVTVHFEPADTAAAEWRHAVYDMLKIQHGRQTALVRGHIILTGAVTK